MVRKANFNEGYTVRTEGDRQIVSFRGDGMSLAAYIILPISTVFIVGGLAGLLPASMWWVPVLVIGAIGYLVYTMFQNQTFILTPSAIIKGGVEYDRARVSEILLDNPMDASVTMSGAPAVFVGGTGLAGASTVAMTGAAMAISRSSAKRRHRVLIRYGAKTIKIARNLNHDHAIAIFNLLARQ